MPPVSSNPPSQVADSRPVWVPIRSLAARHRAGIARHLLALGSADRYLRFGYSATDAQIARYVETLNFERDELFGIFNRRLALIAMAHLAHPGIDAAGGEATASELGVSVLPHARRRGFGHRLFAHAMLHARNRGVRTLMIHALSENFAMLRIARDAGATVVRQGSEADAQLRLPPDTFGSHLDELLGRQAAELDYRLKAGASQLRGHLRPDGTVEVTETAPHVAED